MRIIARAARLSLREWRDMVRAAVELAFARARLGTTSAEDLLVSAGSPLAASSSPAPRNALDARRVSIAIGRVSSRVPWRSDCLVQALAAQRWLRRNGIPSQLFVGVRLLEENRVDAHAWLVSGGTIVTGGDVSGYTPLVTPEVLAALGAR